MSKITVRPYGNALLELHSANMFKSVAGGTYANKLVYSPPVNKQDQVMRSIEALRVATPEAPEFLLPAPLTHG